MLYGTVYLHLLLHSLQNQAMESTHCVPFSLHVRDTLAQIEPCLQVLCEGRSENRRLRVCQDLSLHAGLSGFASQSAEGYGEGWKQLHL